MMLSLSMAMITALILTMLTMKNPLSMMMYIILVSLNMSLMFSMVMSSWYAFLMFLIYVGGMLVMFAYFAATTPNQLKMLIKSSLIYSILLTLIMFPIMYHLNKMMVKTQKYQMMDMYLMENSIMLIMITLVLLLTMVVIVKLTARTKGPMRAFMMNYV